MPSTILFYGRPGSGKGTQASFLQKWLAEKSSRSTIQFEFGMLVREYMKGPSLMQRRTREIIEAGGLLPKFLSISLWSQFFSEHLTGAENILIDGAPRHVFEAEALDSLLHFYGRREPYIVIHLNVSEEVARERLIVRAETNGRIDDVKRDSLERRLAWFLTDTVPVLEFFQSHPQYRIIEIHGELAPEDIHNQIMKELAV